MRYETGYELEVVVKFIDAHGERAPTGRVQSLNGVRMTHTKRDMVERWESRGELVPLGHLDSLLMAHDLMLCELDHWARMNCGRTGWVDPFEEPFEMAC